jgi:hypothetical protein
MAEPENFDVLIIGGEFEGMRCNRHRSAGSANQPTSPRL